MKIYSEKIFLNKEKEVRVLGLKVYKKSLVWYKNSRWTKRKLLFGIFKTLENNDCKLYYFCGIKIFKKKPSLYLRIKRMENTLNAINRKNTVLENKIQTAITVANQHSKVFPQFKDKHKNQAIVLVATGPTMLKYKPIKNAVHIGVNTAYQNKNIELDYWFCIDYKTVSDHIDEIQNAEFTKFFGQAYQSYPYGYYNIWDGHTPNIIIENSKNAYKYYFEHGNYSNININIETQMLPDIRSCIFSPAYFALYTGTKKIYLVGCDAGATGYFNGKKQIVNSLTNNLPKSWQLFGEYVKYFYPDVEIISVNPVYLKGLFRDVYTREYLESNPEIKTQLANDVEFID